MIYVRKFLQVEDCNYLSSNEEKTVPKALAGLVTETVKRMNLIQALNLWKVQERK